MHWCFSCYALNPDPHGACLRCGGPIQGPPDYSYDDWLVWTLGHPDGGRAVLAAQILGVRRVRSALPALRQVVGDASDPFSLRLRCAAPSRSRAVTSCGTGSKNSRRATHSWCANWRSGRSGDQRHTRGACDTNVVVVRTRSADRTRGGRRPHRPGSIEAAAWKAHFETYWNSSRLGVIKSRL